ncbi:unnamed protein product [Adineta ricciae]|uniref:Protein kinase domain-containing protein n=1 Tax=Adineta ricciae TaxID=249248 RepID=A0A814G711_ADIRI|nr:unnamed protein product [Adineta ricciae]CAF1639061.1 unnamed protein product [Adineta ricciae]
MIDDSASDLTCTSATDSSAIGSPTFSQANNGPISKTTPAKVSVKLTQISSTNSGNSFESNARAKYVLRALNKYEVAKFRQRIEEEYKELEITEQRYCYYIEDSEISAYAKEQLKKSSDGTYFLRLATDAERKSGVRYVLCLVSHNETVDVPICYDEDSRTFYFLSSFGLGSEVKIEYNGIDAMLSDKKLNPFIGLPYPFKICLHRPVMLHSHGCIPLPDELRTLDREDNILHELARRNLAHYFRELIFLAHDENHSLKGKAIYILNKINSRNKQGLTPLIIAIQGKKHQFFEILIDSSVDVNVVDGEGRSPIHHACQQANYKFLDRLIEAGANPNYFNRKQTTDGKYLSNLSALHYLAMAKNALSADIQKCARLLLQKGCSLMPLTKEGKSPFDIAQIYDNLAFDCVKVFADNLEFHTLQPVEVSSRREAKSILSDYTGVSYISRIMGAFKQYHTVDQTKNNGLFLFYRKRKTRAQPDEEYGLCVYYNQNVIVYPITERYSASILDVSEVPYESVYRYSLKTDTTMDDHNQVTVFSSYEELIYCHSNHKGVLATKLTDFIRKDYGEWKRGTVADLLQKFDLGNLIPDPFLADPDPIFSDVDLIERITLSDIHSATIIDENSRRLIWVATVQREDDSSFPIIIKDYLPKYNVDIYKSYRLKEFESSLKYNDPPSEIEEEYEYSTRVRHDYKYESKYLLTSLQKNPFIVHAFQCNQRAERDLRIFMEYLPEGNLYSYIKQLNPQSIELRINAYHWIYQLAQAMAFLSKFQIVHRDLAARNVLLKDENHIKLSDFGLSRAENVELKGKECIISPCWAAPECFAREQRVSTTSDVWAFAVVVWEIFSFGAKPYATETDINDTMKSQQVTMILKRFLIEQGRRLTKPECCSVGLHDLMSRCWNIDATRRPRFVKIVDEFNRNSMMIDRLKPFSKDEQRALRNASKYYREAWESFATSPEDGYTNTAATAKDLSPKSEP